MPRDAIESPPTTFPETLGECADLLYMVHHERLKQEKIAAKLQKQETEIKDYVISRLTQENSGAMGKIAKVARIIDVIPVIDDWDVLYKYVKKTNMFNLLQKRLSTRAIEEIWESGKEVPGVKTFDKVSLSITKK